MSRSFLLGGPATCAAILALAVVGPPGYGQVPQPAGVRRAAKAPEAPSPKPRPPWREAEDAIRRRLSQPVSVDFDKTPLKDAAAFLQKTCGIPILLDGGALRDLGIKPDAPMSFRVSDITLRSVLRLMLRQRDLTYVVRNEVLLITTPEAAEGWEITRLYAVGDLCANRGHADEVYYDIDSLGDLIRASVQPDTWGEGIQGIPSVDFGSVAALAVTQTDEVHEEVASLLRALRAVAQRTAEGKPADPIVFNRIWPEPPAYALLRKGLSRKVSLDFKEAPLVDVIDHLRKLTGMNIVLDRRALEDVYLAEDVPVSIHVAGLPVQSALRQMLRDLDLTCQVWDEVLLITTPEGAEMRLTIGVYPLGDQVAGGPMPPWAGYDGGLLEELITCSVEPETWGRNGGPGTVHHVAFDNLNALVIVNTRDVHDMVGELLARVQSIARQATKDSAADPIKLLKEFFEGVPRHAPLPSALSKKVDFDFHDTRLTEVTECISNSCGIQCRIDQHALDDVGVPPDTPVSVHLAGITLRSALDLLLRDLYLTWVVQDGVLLITTPEQAEKRLTLEIYPVGDLVTFQDENGKLWEDYDWLWEVIKCDVSPDTWHDVGGDGSIGLGTFAGARILIVVQTDRAHEEIAELLEELRALRRQASKEGRPPRRIPYWQYGVRGGGFW